jgi:hypothetical protein
MPSFTGPSYTTPFGKNEFLRSTQDIKTESRTVSRYSVPAVTIDGFDGQKVLQPGVIMAAITSGAEAGKVGPYQEGGTNEVQRVTITGTPTGGSFTLTYDGQTTAAIAYNANAATVQAALEALSNIAVGDITCAGGALPGSFVTVTFNLGTVTGGENVAEMTADGAALTGGTSPAVAVTTTTAGVDGATDGRQTLANIVGINQTFLPTQLMHRDVEIAVIYEASVVSANLLMLNAAGEFVAATQTVLDHLAARQPRMNIILAR